jgi:hypothetical protein
MLVQTQEARIIFAMEATRTIKKINITRAAKTYNVPPSTLRDRLRDHVLLAERRNAQHKLTLTEEETLVRYILDLDSRGFPTRISGVEDMANLLLATRCASRVGKQWAYRFVQRRPELKARFSRAYDFQRALCEDPELILRLSCQRLTSSCGHQHQPDPPP